MDAEEASKQGTLISAGNDVRGMCAVPDIRLLRASAFKTLYRYVSVNVAVALAVPDITLLDVWIYRAFQLRL